MNESSIVISFDTFRTLSKTAQGEIISALVGEPKETATVQPSVLLDEEDENFAQLSPTQVRDLYSGCQDKTRKALEVIAQSKSRRFHIADVAKAVMVEPKDLSGVWRGLTRRVRTVTGEARCYLIDWTSHDPVLDKDDNYIDQIGEVSELTYHSLRKILLK